MDLSYSDREGKGQKLKCMAQPYKMKGWKNAQLFDFIKKNHNSDVLQSKVDEN